MSPKKRVIIIICVFIVTSIIVNLTIIAYNGGFSNSNLVTSTGSQKLWKAGNNIKSGDFMVYELQTKDNQNNIQNRIVNISFYHTPNEYWNTRFIISNQTGSSMKFVEKLSKSNLLVKDPDERNKEYLKEIETTILSIRDVTREQKYLIIGAQWDTISSGVSTIPMKITSNEDLETPIGKVNAYVLNYKLNNTNNNIWISEKFPLPIKAEIHDEEGKIIFKYLIKNTNIKSSLKT